MDAFEQIQVEWHRMELKKPQRSAIWAAIGIFAAAARSILSLFIPPEWRGPCAPHLGVVST